MKGPTRPPRWMERLLAAACPAGLVRDTILGDLHEEFLERAERSYGAAVARYATDGLVIALRYWLGRLWGSNEFGTDGTDLSSSSHATPPNAPKGSKGWARDLRFALRRIRRSPGLTAVVVITMAVAIGSNAAIFGAVRPVVAPELPFPESDRIMRIWEQNAERGWVRSSASWHDARDWAAASQSFESMAVYTVWEGNLGVGAQSERIRYGLVEPDFFRVLGVAPALGRTLTAEEGAPDRGDVVVLSHALWMRAFGADRDIIGRAVPLAGRSLTVVGVMPASFTYPATDVDAWKPFGMTPDEGGSRDSYWVSAIGRLAEGVQQAEAQEEMSAIGLSLEESYPDTNRGFRPLLEPMADVAVLNAREGVMLLWIAVGLLLLVACTNVATLLLARGEARANEMAVRTSLGASKVSLVRQLLVESLVTAALGGVAGLALAVPATQGVAHLMGGRLSYGLGVELNLEVVAYTLGVTAVAAVAFGLIPALRTSGQGASTFAGARSAAARSTGRLGAALVSGQTALAVVILVGAGLLGRTFVELVAVEPGYPVDEGVTFRVAPPQEGVERPEADVMLEGIRSAVGQIPGVASVAGVNRLPQAGGMWGSQWTDQSRTDEPGLRAFARVVQPGYLTTLGVPLLAGRAFNPSDDAASEPVAVVSQSAAERYWPDGNALGSVISLAPDRAPWVRVIGIVGDVEERTTGVGASATVYTPFTQSVFGHFGDWGTDFLVRADGDVAALVPAVRAAISDLYPSLPVFAVATLEERLGSQLDGPRALALLMGLFAATGLFLSALGVYGTLAYSVARRTPEIGVRLALGAASGTVVKSVFARGMAMALVGLGVGLLVAGSGRRWVEELLFGVDAFDLVTYVVITLIILMVAALASVLPAARAARLDPVDALRMD